MTGRRMVDRWEDDNKMFMSLAIKKRVLPSLYGGIVGDLLGVPVEFKKRGTFTINDITGYGTYNQPPGTWSDDTSLTLCLIENLIEKRRFIGANAKIRSIYGIWLLDTTS
ncbi:ADP-ribosylglycohydrolase family protein [Peribacillus frigoritolerans]|nr:ADP-ribosylglycohydrolase family protein [Peribacillus frigoritolerans]